MSDDFSVELPPQARLAGLRLDDDAKALRLEFADGGAETVIPAGTIELLCGASISSSELTPRVAEPAIIPLVVRRRQSAFYETPESVEEITLVLGLRAAGFGQLFYLVADSFNFRSALGADMTYSQEANLRALIGRLIAIAPQAARDDFVNAIVGRVPTPPPLASLVDFFKTAGQA